MAKSKYCRWSERDLPGLGTGPVCQEMLYLLANFQILEWILDKQDIREL